MESAIKGGFQIWARPYCRDVFVGDTVENRTLGMVKGGKAAASHSVPPPVHPLKDFFPIPRGFVCELEYIIPCP